jgi:hypothetical protein
MIKQQRKKKSKIYFGSPAQDAIVEYNNCDNPEIRSKIYEDRIRYAFEKLAENVLNTFKFSYFDDSKDDIKKEVVSVLLEKIHMYQSDKGRAFSYFTKIARNYLILENNGNYNRWKKTNLLSDMPAGWDVENDFERNQTSVELDEFRTLMIKFWDLNLTNIFKKKRDIQIADAVIELFRRVDSIENFNKKHLYLLVREMTDCKTHYITKVVKIMKEYYKVLINEYLEYGTVNLSTNICFFNLDNEIEDD